MASKETLSFSVFHRFIEFTIHIFISSSNPIMFQYQAELKSNPKETLGSSYLI